MIHGQILHFTKLKNHAKIFGHYCVLKTGDCSIGKSILHKPHRMKLTLSFSFIYEAICPYTFSPARKCMYHKSACGHKTNHPQNLLHSTYEKRKHYINANTQIHWFYFFGECGLFFTVLSTKSKVRVQTARFVQVHLEQILFCEAKTKRILHHILQLEYWRSRSSSVF